jgi:hypothetical protein
MSPPVDGNRSGELVSVDASSSAAAGPVVELGADAAVLAVDTDLAAASVGDDLLCAPLGLSLGRGVGRRSLSAGRLDVPATVRVEDDMTVVR